MPSAAYLEQDHNPYPSSRSAVRAILTAHNYYRQAGGEDQGFLGESKLLERHGHTVVRYEDDNKRIGKAGFGTALGTVWSNSSYRRLDALIRSSSVDIAHFHNTFPLISPAAYYAVRKARIPVVQTLQNYRLLCPGATFLRNSVVCEDCLKQRSLLPSVLHGCYQESRAATSTIAAMLSVHSLAGTWQKAVDVYVAVSRFGRQKFIEGGLPADRIVVKPNFVSPDPGFGDGHGGYALFVGRLAKEKGVETLAEAWRSLQIPLLVAGDGPLRDTAWPGRVRWLGAQPRDKVMALMREARVLVFPSTWYECAPMTIVEAFACGLPVIASNLGSIPEFVRHGYNGLLFEPRDPQALAEQVQWAFDHPVELRTMRANARREFEENYTAERNYKLLMAIYETAIENVRRRRNEAV